MRSLRRPSLVALALVALAGARPALAEEKAPPPARVMSLGAALAYAHEHQPALREGRARVQVALRDVDVSRARWYPLLTAAAELAATTTNNTTGSYLAVPGLDNPRISATRVEAPHSSSLAPSASSLVGFGLRQEIYDFGRIGTLVAADELRVDVARLSSGAARLVVDYDIEEAYFAVHAAKGVLEASEKAYARAVVHRDLAKAGVETGMRRPIELTRAEAVTDRYELERIRARSGVSTAQTVLAASVGVPEHRLDIEGEPPPVPDVPGLDAALGRALERNPELSGALLRIRAQERETSAVSAEKRPNLLLSGAMTGNAGGATPTSGEPASGRGLLPAVPNWDVALVLAWPLFDETVSARVERSRAKEAEAREHLDLVRTKVVAAVEEAYLAVDAARASLPVLRHALVAAVANYDQANARFDVGLGNAVELADAEELRVAAEIQLALGTFELARARAALGRAAAEGL